MNKAIIGLGSNINPEVHIPLALRLLSEQVIIEKVSALITTKPIGISAQPDFVNGAVRIATSLSREELELFLKNTEDHTGRDRSLPRFGPRTIDLDIVVWNGKIIDPDYHTRDFLRSVVDEIIEEKEGFQRNDKKKGSLS